MSVASRSAWRLVLIITQCKRPTGALRHDPRRVHDGSSLAVHMNMRTWNHTSDIRRSAHLAVGAALLLFGISIPTAEAQQTSPETRLTRSLVSSWTRLGHIDHALALSDLQTRNMRRPVWRAATPDHTHRGWPLRADPRRWPRLFANTTECTLSFDPVLRRHWWQ